MPMISIVFAEFFYAARLRHIMPLPPLLFFATLFVTPSFADAAAIARRHAITPAVR